MSVFRWILGPLWRPALARAEGLLGGREPELVDPFADAFGMESAGRRQLRGNGCLALGPDLLVFAMWVPRRNLVIARSRIQEIDTPREFLGVTLLGSRLLRVAWLREDGTRDRAAFVVRDLAAWLDALGYVAPPQEAWPPNGTSTR